MKTLAALCLVPLLISQTFAFNLETHAFITREARDRSVLNKDNTDLAQRYGFDRLEPKHIFDNQNSFRCLATSPNSVAHRDAYIDARDAWLKAPGSNPRANVFGRCLTLFEQLSMPPDYTGLLPNPNASVGTTGWLRLEGWLMRGAIREDDFESGAYDNPNLIPDQDPWLDEFRSVHHFYNPISDGTYFGALSVDGTRSTTWALGIADDANWENVQLPDVARGNHFSYADARKLMFLALTYKRDLIVNYRDESQLRMNMWATMFKSLGHIVHLLQDTASPQHVRGEGHSRLCNGTRRQDIPEQPEATRTFENFTNYRVTVPFDAELDRAGIKKGYSFANLCDDYKWRDMFKTAGQASPTDTDPWTGAGNTYPIPQFSVQRKFFTTRTEDAAINARRGLADYVNRGFFTEGAFLRSDGAPDPNFPSPPPLANGAYTPGTSSTDFIPGLGNIENQTLYWAVPDAIAPNYPDRGLINAKAPIVARSMWTSVVPDGPGSMEVQSLGGNLTLKNYVQIADMTAPRAVAYTAGFFNFFFRGKLTVDPIQLRVFAVMNQGEPHTMDADGYPIRTSNGQIFGFEKIRLRVRNSTDPITESGTNTVVPQTVGAGKLVAVARYHRNPCYKPDLTGERWLDFNNTLTEPNCPQGLRTNYQEISVSAPLTITDNAGLPFGTTIAASVEKVFDFAADPIPVNATDLFIQVVYRGQLGAETDGIAVGTIDTQEPTIVGSWNNTDHYYSNVGLNWLIQNGTNFSQRGIDGLSICTGSPSVLLYRYASPQDGLNIPFLNGTLNPGIVRLALINAKFPSMVNQQPYRMVATFNAPPYMPQRVTQSRGQLRQASQEIFAAGALPAPVLCQSAEPTVTPYWCFDPIKRRRGQPIGDAAQPLYFSTSAGSDGTDVDLPPALPVYSGLRPVIAGTVHFNSDTVLMTCPAQQQ